MTKPGRIIFLRDIYINKGELFLRPSLFLPGVMVWRLDRGRNLKGLKHYIFVKIVLFFIKGLFQCLNFIV